ncbi:nuclear transport factor 2 family protein [Cysteiniphilum sp. QT6929]|uniref:nuclear transport factor 2 family protein n=1 Tax=Cysteiniphilum sp. QT6929 TaxID=2975055 RepID=UPI0024B3221F|nr:nuclear transport factor 2 family protein [Cysteiniphilum sp. QT6929]WHN65007.1 nuclear transport factor 2 family protein [Cysteiniphilum sp. QT6929]
MNRKTITQTRQEHCSDKKELLVRIFKIIFEKDGFDEADIHKYFHPDYTQYVDGKILKFDNFIAHIKALKSTVSQVKIHFEHLIVEGNKVCSVHYPEAKKINGMIIKAKVIAMFEFKGDQLILCDELTHLIEGDKEDEDLGSRH